MKTLDIKNAKIIRLVSGEEIACKLDDSSAEEAVKKSRLIRLKDPMLIKYVPQLTEGGIADYIALVRWVGFTRDKIVTIPIDKILTICNATPEFNERYTQIVGKLENIKDNLPSYIERNLKKEEWDDSEQYDDIDKDDIKELSDLLNMPSKKIH